MHTFKSNEGKKYPADIDCLEVTSGLPSAVQRAIVQRIVELPT